MAKDISAYVGGCWLCSRYKGATKPRTTRGLLEEPQIPQLVSLDYVGSYQWMGARMSYLVIIDHCSRFMVAVSTTIATAAETGIVCTPCDDERVLTAR